MGLAGFLFRMCLGHLSFTLRMLCGCVAGGLHLCLRLRGERGSHVCLCTCLHVPLGVSLSVPGGGAVDPPALFLSVGLCLCLSPGLRQPHTLCAGEGGGLCSSASVSSVSGRVGARLCPSVPVNTRASVPAWCGRPASAGRCTQPTRARGFFGTDTLPPSAQMIQSPHPPAQSRELREPQGPPPGRSFSFLFPFLQPGPRGGLKVLAFRGGLKAGERGQLDWGPRAEEGCSQLVASRGLPGMAPGGLPELSLLGLKAWHIRNSPGAPI